MKPIFLLSLAGLLLGDASIAEAQHQHASAPRCTTADLACANTATPVFAEDGSLWLAWAAAGRVMAAHSTDLGRSFAPAVAVNREPARIDNGPDARPKIAIDRAGRIHVAYAVFQDDRYNGRVYVGRSEDGGKSFAEPHPITDDSTSQRFEALAIDPGGDVFAAWLDKRNAAAARAESKNYPGAALAFSWSSNGGARFSAAQIAQDQTCECCRLAIAFAGPHRPVVLFRNIFDGTTRDHAVVTFADAAIPGPLHRVSRDEWRTNVCPHQGPALAVAEDGTYHVAWFTDGQTRKGLFYARSADAGAHYSEPMGFGAGRAERPALLAQGKRVWLAWKEFDGEGTALRLMTSGDRGVTWSPAETVAATRDSSDQPALIANRDGVFLSWLTGAEGYRLLRLPGAS